MLLDKWSGIEFDEDWYLSNYPDVAKAVGTGAFGRGLYHYLYNGAIEGRRPYQGAPQIAARPLGPETAKNHARRLSEDFYAKYLAGAVLDIGYMGGQPHVVPITDKAIGIELGYPGYDGVRLPFPDESQDAVFASHCLEHIPDWRTVLSDWYRVVKVSGYLVIAVPHRDLYERKAERPSRFNGDHMRFYTPASLLAEIEEALPVAGYRVWSLRDIDTAFDYSIPPDKHAIGCYEVELVVQKIAIPYYADSLRP